MVKLSSDQKFQIEMLGFLLFIVLYPVIAGITLKSYTGDFSDINTVFLQFFYFIILIPLLFWKEFILPLFEQIPVITALTTNVAFVMVVYIVYNIIIYFVVKMLLSFIINWFTKNRNVTVI